MSEKRPHNRCGTLVKFQISAREHPAAYFIEKRSQNWPTQHQISTSIAPDFVLHIYYFELWATFQLFHCISPIAIKTSL